MNTNATLFHQFENINIPLWISKMHMFKKYLSQKRMQIIFISNIDESASNESNLLSFVIKNRHYS